MTATAFNTYSGMIDRGSCDLALIDSALTKRYITTDEATRLRAKWHSVYDLVKLAATVQADRSQVVSWDAPNVGIGQVYVTRTIGTDQVVRAVAPTADPVTFPAPGDAEAQAQFSAVVTAANGYQGPAATTSVAVPAVPAPEPTPAPEPQVPVPAETPAPTEG